MYHLKEFACFYYILCFIGNDAKYIPLIEISAHHFYCIFLVSIIAYEENTLDTHTVDHALDIHAGKHAIDYSSFTLYQASTILQSTFMTFVYIQIHIYLYIFLMN